MNTHPLQQILQTREQGRSVGIYSCCSAHPFVLETAFQKGKIHNSPVLVEATANQVNQYGGYTGMNPADFYSFVHQLVNKCGIDPALVMLGGDHLGPLTFSHLPEKEAMAKSAELIRQYVLAGFTKIHLDTSMRLADDDPAKELPIEVIASRGATLCCVAEEAFKQRNANHLDSPPLIYVIGSEVPIPGGAQDEEEGISVTLPEACRQTIEAFKLAFANKNLTSAWQRIIGVVVQPGVEFGNAQVRAYNREEARSLTAVIHEYPGIVFEGHSTDYQTKYALREMVEDGIAILKVGPAVTFALREGLIALEAIERELYSDKNIGLSDFRNTLDTAMLDRPQNWNKHYHGNAVEQRFARIFSYSDRARYYISDPPVQSSIERLLYNLRQTNIPLTLISQYMPIQYTAVIEGRLGNDPQMLLMDRIGNCIDEYLFATGILANAPCGIY